MVYVYEDPFLFFYKYLDETKRLNNFLHADIQLNVRENS